MPKIVNSKMRRDERRNFVRRVRALSLPNDLNLSESGYPEIEILTVAAAKDFEVLPYTLKSAIRNSKNPVKRITVICPEQQVESCFQIIKDSGIQENVNVLNENEIIEESVRTTIREKFGARYGWVLQQALATYFIGNSNAAGILLINADTVLINQAHWLDGIGNQILMPSLEFHEPYYKLLRTVMKFKITPRNTFITHHMLFQPECLRTIIKYQGYSNVLEFINAAIMEANADEPSSMCIEFEPYAQGMLKYYSNRVTLKKFSNLGVQRTQENLRKLEQLVEKELSYPYNSVSLHDYL